MCRHSTAVVLGVALLAASSGCRHAWFASNSRADVPCHLTGSEKPIAMPMEGCFDPISGQPVPCPPSSSTVIPGGTHLPGVGPGWRQDELPYPAPGEMIPPAGVPFAPPGAAPGGMGVAPAAPKTAVQVKGPPKQ